MGPDPAGALATASGLVREHGIVFGKGDAKQDFVLDPIPRIVEAAEWAELERGLAQRARALNALLADVYGERRIVAEGVIPARVIEGAEYFEPEMEGMVGPRAATVIGFDLVRDRDGRFLVLEDNSRTPSGMAYAVAARRGQRRALRRRGRRRWSRSTRCSNGWARRFARPRPMAVDDPVAILVSDGPGNSAWYEHTVVARRIGLPLVQPDDLVRKDDEVHFRDESGAVRRVDVVLRRTDADRVSEQGTGTTWVGEKLYEPLRAGKVRMVNTFGSGLADDKLVYAYVPEAIRFYLDEEPLVDQIPTLDCANEESLARVIESAAELVMKPRSESGGIGVVVGSQASSGAARGLRRSRQTEPEGLHRAGDREHLDLPHRRRRRDRAPPRGPARVRRLRQGRGAPDARRPDARRAHEGVARRELEPGRRRQGHLGHFRGEMKSVVRGPTVGTPERWLTARISTSLTR